MKHTIKKYQCKRCGYIKKIKTNHFEECYSCGHYNTCPKCPPFAKYPEYGGYTIWKCMEKQPNKKRTIAAHIFTALTKT